MHTTKSVPTDQSHPITKEIFVVVFDLINFIQYSSENESSKIFSTLNEFYLISKKIIEEHNGKLVKFIGDAGLCYFEREHSDKAVMAMLKLKENIDDWFGQKVKKGGLAVNGHFGPVTIGRMVSADGESIDLIGSTVNTTFTLGKRQFLISPQAFRTLSPETRQRFKKYTPPIVYKLA